MYHLFNICSKPCSIVIEVFWDRCDILDHITMIYESRHFVVIVTVCSFCLWFNEIIVFRPTTQSFRLCLQFINDLRYKCSIRLFTSTTATGTTDVGFKGFYSKKYNQLHTSRICGLLRLTSIYITYYVRIKPLVYTIIFQWSYVTRLPRVSFNQSHMTWFFMSEISLKYFERKLRAR